MFTASFPISKLRSRMLSRYKGMTPFPYITSLSDIYNPVYAPSMSQTSILQFFNHYIVDIISGNMEKDEWTVEVKQEPKKDAAIEEDLSTKMKNAAEYTVLIQSIQPNSITMDIIAKQRIGYVLQKEFKTQVELKRNDATEFGKYN